MWREIRTEHFLLETSLDSEAAARTARTLERFRTALIATGWQARQQGPAARLEVVVPEYGVDLYEFTRGEFLGYVTLGRDRLAVMAGEVGLAPGGDSWRVFMHELAHSVTQTVLPNQPRWLSEGLAAYLETLTLEDEGATAVVGRVHSDYHYLLRGNRPMALARLWQWEAEGRDPRKDDIRYASSWLTVHYLFARQREQFDDFQNRLNRGEAPRAAFETAFHSLSPSALDAEITEYLGLARYASRPVPVPQTQAELVEHPLSEADVHVLRARLIASAPRPASDVKRESRALHELEAALIHQPGHVAAQVLRGRLIAQADERLIYARRVATQHPEDGRAWLLLAECLDTNPSTADERLSALQRAVELAPRNAEALMQLALENARRREATPAREHAEAALALTPWDPMALTVLALARILEGKCEEAIELQTRALGFLPERTPAETGEMLRGQLAEYQKLCAH